MFRKPRKPALSEHREPKGWGNPGFMMEFRKGGPAPSKTHYFNSASQFVTSTTGAVLSVMESTTKNFPSRATSYACAEIE